MVGHGSRHRIETLAARTTTIMSESLSSPIASYCTAINFVLGAGVLGLPYAVASAGMLASAIALILVAGLSILTCSWLLEVGDRANSLQNLLSRGGVDGLAVQHVNGGLSVLPPASPFLRRPAHCASLHEPLLDRTERKLDEYRAAYRSWRTGSHQGARDSDLRRLMPLLVYQASRHRELLPLQLLPPPKKAALGDAASEDQLEAGQVANGCECAEGRLSSTFSSRANSTQSLDAMGARTALPAVAKLERSSSFSVDLAAALRRLPPHQPPLDEEEEDGGADGSGGASASLQGNRDADADAGQPPYRTPPKPPKPRRSLRSTLGAAVQYWQAREKLDRPWRVSCSHRGNSVDYTPPTLPTSSTAADSPPSALTPPASKEAEQAATPAAAAADDERVTARHASCSASAEAAKAVAPIEPITPHGTDPRPSRVPPILPPDYSTPTEISALEVTPLPLASEIASDTRRDEFLAPRPAVPSDAPHPRVPSGSHPLRAP